jgi:hypothetical protein
MLDLASKPLLLQHPTRKAARAARNAPPWGDKRTENVARVAQSAGRHRMTPGVGFAFPEGWPQLASSMSFVPCRAGKPREEGPLARDGTTQRAARREPADTTQQHCARRPSASVERPAQRLPCVHWLPRGRPGGAASDTVWRVPCRWSQAILCWDSPQCCLSSRVLPPSVLLGATSSCWVASGSSCKIFLVGVAQSQQCASVPRLTNLELRPSLGGAGSLKAPQPSIQSRHCIWACLSRRTPDARSEWPASWDEPYGTPKL